MIIALTGRKGSGKTTLAKKLAVEYNYTRLPFAKPIKEMLQELLVTQGLGYTESGRMLDGDLKEVPTDYLNGRTPRYAMQTLGTEWGRDLVDVNLWTSVWLRTAKIITNVVVDDLRFESEAEAVRNIGGIVIRVYRESADTTDLHPSEIEMHHIRTKYTVENDKTIKEAWEQLKLILDIERYNDAYGHKP